jgi:hypothetical protein
MKKLLTALVMATMIAGQAQAVEPVNKNKITAILDGAGLQSTWSTDISLWIKNPGYDKYTLEGFGHQLCAGTQGKGVGFYVITFWHQFGSGQITKVKCSS